MVCVLQFFTTDKISNISGPVSYNLLLIIHVQHGNFLDIVYTYQILITKHMQHGIGKFVVCETFLAFSEGLF